MVDPTGPRPLEKKKILIVEDEYLIAAQLVDELELLGAEIVGPSPSLERALELVKTEPVDLAVLDINLQGKLCFPLADALSERGISFIFQTGYDPDLHVPQRYASVPRWHKPFTPQALAASLALYMSQNRRTVH
jgi:DNA-binding response OmpR family regulator